MVGARLAGSIWLPREEPRAGVLMLPGSGPADRHNDWFFPPIRDELLRAGIAVASFDKRGVGGSTGSWETSGFDVLAADVAMQLHAFDDVGLARDRIGLFGHSQGGWIALETVARDHGIGFVILDSGPAVGVEEQCRYELATSLSRSGLGDGRVGSALSAYDEAIARLRAADDAGGSNGPDEHPAESARLATALLDVGDAIPTEREWSFLRLIIDHDPLPAMGSVTCPLLAIYGEDDVLVPVERSVEILEREVDPGLLTIVVFPGADHRLQVGEPRAFASGYHETLRAWILEQSR